jgi:hypothetical protein
MWVGEPKSTIHTSGINFWQLTTHKQKVREISLLLANKSTFLAINIPYSEMRARAAFHM